MTENANINIVSDVFRTTILGRVIMLKLHPYDPLILLLDLKSWSYYTNVDTQRFLRDILRHVIQQFEPFIPEFLKWTLPFLNLVRAIATNRGLSKNQSNSCKQCRSWWGGSLWAVSSGFTLFAKTCFCRHDVAATLNRRYYDVVCLLGWLLYMYVWHETAEIVV